MTRKQLWRKSPEFQRLCDLVASDRLVIITGAGISSQLRQKFAPSNRLPQWWELLKALYPPFKSALTSEEKSDCERLLQIGAFSPKKGKPAPSGKELILAASILRRKNPRGFDKQFRRTITPVHGTYSATHEVINKLEPLGILTFNYDDAHESAFAANGKRLKAILPHQENRLKEALISGARPFYIKAHGSIASKSELVLTVESYRQLIVKSPAYRAFVQDILTNRQILFLGFGLSDPDFDLFIEAMANQFGSPLHDHVVIWHRNSRNVNDVSLRRRFGIHALYISDYADIPEILADTLTQTGPILRKMLKMCLSKSRRYRNTAHSEFKRLGTVGKKCACNALIAMIPQFEKKRKYFELSEVAYSLGEIDARANKAVLMKLVEEAKHVDPVGRALTVLRPVLKLSDLPQLRRWRKRFIACPLPGLFANRIVSYLDYLLVYLPSKFRS